MNHSETTTTRTLRLIFSAVILSAAPVSLAQSVSTSNPDAAASTPAMVKKSSPAIATMQAVEDRWDDSLNKRDQYGLELVLADQFIDISATGDVTNRNQQIARLFAKDSGILSIEQKVATVRVFGDLAIANGTYVQRSKANGQTVEQKGIFTHVMQQVRGNWRCVNSQRTIVVEQAVVKPKAPAKKARPGDLPLDIPLIHKPKDSQ